MQAAQFNNEFIRNCAMKIRESHNHIFQIATTAIDNDKACKLSDGAKELLKAGTMYEYRVKWGGDYGRLYQLSVISLCSEIEYFFKALFERYGFEKSSGGFGFYQRINDVFKSLSKSGIDFSDLQSSVQALELAFQVRHIGVHNMGFVDEKFKATTGLGLLNEKFIITQDVYMPMYNACESLLLHLDKELQ